MKAVVEEEASKSQLLQAKSSSKETRLNENNLFKEKLRKG